MCCGYSCLCDSCANEVNNIHSKPEEVNKSCFHCEEECFLYDHEFGKYTHPVRECQGYIITNYHAELRRNKFKII
jgi:hypothetical protein